MLGTGTSYDDITHAKKNITMHLFTCTQAFMCMLQRLDQLAKDLLERGIIRFKRQTLKLSGV